ncbi:Fur family transcriptional regulator [Streptomyces sp. PTY087I2]|uniref:Fur family transcriptional regulator n=1 Tax=Streptomyces sp. PTY087I2 TaxID=1819298 RepID=UPI0009A03DC8
MRRVRPKPQRRRRGRERVAERRADVIAALKENAGFLTASELHATMVRSGNTIGLTTVYRALARAEREGLLEAVRQDGGARAYRHLPQVHAHHLTCRECGHGVLFASAEFEAWVETLGQRYGFLDVRHAVSATGTCSGCTTALNPDSD